MSVVAVFCAAVFFLFASCLRERETNEGRLCSKHTWVASEKNCWCTKQKFPRVRQSFFVSSLCESLHAAACDGDDPLGCCGSTVIYIYIFCFFELRLGAQLPFILIFPVCGVGLQGGAMRRSGDRRLSYLFSSCVGIF